MKVASRVCSRPPCYRLWPHQRVQQRLTDPKLHAGELQTCATRQNLINQVCLRPRKSKPLYLRPMIDRNRTRSITQPPAVALIMTTAYYPAPSLRPCPGWFGLLNAFRHT